MYYKAAKDAAREGDKDAERIAKDLSAHYMKRPADTEEPEDTTDTTDTTGTTDTTDTTNPGDNPEQPV